MNRNFCSVSMFFYWIKKISLKRLISMLSSWNQFQNLVPYLPWFSDTFARKPRQAIQRRKKKFWFCSFALPFINVCCSISEQGSSFNFSSKLFFLLWSQNEWDKLDRDLVTWGLERREFYNFFKFCENFYTDR